MHHSYLTVVIKSPHVLNVNEISIFIDVRSLEFLVF